MRLFGAEGRSRTDDPAVFSRMLYHLSYLGPERAMGFEPTTSSLARKRSTAELRPHHLMDPAGFEPALSSVQTRCLPAWPRALYFLKSGEAGIRTLEGAF